MKLLLGAAGLALAPHTAAEAISQDDIDKTEAQLSAAQQKYNEVQQQLEGIASEYEVMSQELAATLAQIDGVNAEIANTEQQIEEKEAELQEKRDRLSRRIRSAYKAGGDEALSAILMSSSFPTSTTSTRSPTATAGSSRTWSA